MEVWYRKWRPQTFAEVVGQNHVTQTLARAVATDRVAHAYLFCGPRGTGKTSTARILAKAVNCEANRSGQPCTECNSCRAVAEGRALDLIEMDAASNRGIDEIRGLREKVGYSPNSARFKVYLIDEVHELTAFAFDALLKTLEEPPAHVIFVLATTEVHKVPETILSRCQRFDFARIKLVDVVTRLRQIADHEGVQISDGALELIARRATGSLRDAVNLLEQAVAAQGAVLTETDVRGAAGLAGDQRAVKLVEEALQRRLPDALNLIAEVRDDGIDLRQFTALAVQHVRSVLLAKAGADASLGVDDETLAVLRTLATESPLVELLRLARLLTAADFRSDPLSPLPLELALIEFVEMPATAPAVQQPAEAHRDERRPTAAPEAAAGAAARVRSALAPRTGPPPEPRRAASGGVTPAGAAVPEAAAETQPASTAPLDEAAVHVPESTRANGASASDGPKPSEPAKEASAAATAATTADGAAVLGLEQAQRRFREIYERCAQLERSAARLLNSGGCDIVEIDAGQVTIGFKHPRMVELATTPAIDATIRRSVTDVLGREYGVRYVHASDVPSRLRLLAAERPSHLLDEALKLGARPVEQP